MSAGFIQQYNAGTSLSALHCPPERQLQMEKTNRSISVREGEEVTLPCRLQDALLPDTQPAATWFQVKSSGSGSALLILHPDGTVEYPQERLAARLFLRRASALDFSLTMSSVERGDAGVYYCQLQGWRLQSEGKALQALAHSGYTQLIAIPPGNSAGCQGLITLRGSSPHSHAGARN